MTKEEYYHHLWQQNLHRMAGCGTVLIVLSILVSLLTLVSCRTIKTDEKTDIQDSTIIKYVEKIVEVPVVVTVEVPAEEKERETPDTTSVLETGFAWSEARINWRDGIPWLFHSLKNKPQSIQKETKVPVKQTYKIIYRTRYVTRTKTIEKQLSWWQQAKVDLAEYVILGLLILMVYLCIKTRLRR